MNEEPKLIEAILTEADDNVHRLVYADWLLENDPDREPFVRAQAVLGPSLRTAVGGKLVPIPAGTFTMGSPDDERGRDYDEQAHEVTLTRAFYMGATPVTIAEYTRFVEAASYEPEGVVAGEFELSLQDWRDPGWEQGSEEPVIYLSWSDAVAFCEWLSREDGLPYRLPSEAEWEYACRAGTTTPYFFGEELTPEQANYNRPQGLLGTLIGTQRPKRTTSVREHPPNAFGLYDMHGNAWEWCSDWYDPMYYEQSRKRDPQGARGGFGRVLRGGAWCHAAGHCRSAMRRCGNPRYSRYTDGATGFRLAMTMPLPEKKARRRKVPR